MKVTRLIAVFAGFVAAGQIAFYSLRLPRMVASHFDLVGNPNGWMSKGAFVALYGGFIAFFLLLAFGTQLLIAKIPAGSLNLPNRDYWLSGDREADTRADLAEMTTWIFVGILIFFVVAFQLIFEANVGYTRNLPMNWFWPVFFGFILFVIGWVVRLYSRFRLPDEGIR